MLRSKLKKLWAIEYFWVLLHVRVPPPPPPPRGVPGPSPGGTQTPPGVPRPPLPPGDVPRPHPGGVPDPPPCGQTDRWMEGQTLVKTLPSLVLRTRAVITEALSPVYPQYLYYALHYSKESPVFRPSIYCQLVNNFESFSLSRKLGYNFWDRRKSFYDLFFILTGVFIFLTGVMFFISIIMWDSFYLLQLISQIFDVFRPLIVKPCC